MKRFLNEEDFFQKTKEEQKRIWFNMGFLEGLNKKQQEEVSDLYNELYKHFTNTHDKYENQIFIETVVFPIVRRCIQIGDGLIESYTPAKLCRFIDITYPIFKQALWLLGDNVDIEVEYVKMVANYFNKINK